MATTEVIKFSNRPAAGYKLDKHSLVVSKAKKYHELTSRLTEKALSDTNTLFTSLLQDYSFVFKGTVDPALGEGKEFITVYGGVETEPFIPKQGGDTVYMKLPFQRKELTEVIKQIFRFRTITRKPDILAANTVFIKPSQLFEFYRMKRGILQEGNAKGLGLILTAVFQYNPFNLYVKDGSPADLLGVEADELTNKDLGDLTDRAKLDKIIQEVNKDVTGKKEQAFMQMVIKELTKEMIEKEKNIKNIGTYTVREGNPEKIDDYTPVRNSPPDANFEWDKSKLEKLFKRNKDIGSFETACGLIRLIDRVSSKMSRPSYQNMPYYTGNTGTAPTGTDTNIADFQACARDKQIVLMNPAVVDFLRSFVGYSQTGSPTYSPNIGSILSSLRIVPVPGMAPNIIKIGSSDRYNIFQIYEKTATDTLGQEGVSTDTHHIGGLAGIREHVPFAMIVVQELNLDPIDSDNIIEPITQAKFQ